jgi:hypothetical protein
MTSTQRYGAGNFGDATWELPPLILHPFASRAASERLLEDSRSALTACEALFADGAGREEVAQRLLQGRFSEIRMLFYLGKDLLRWIAQCVEFTESVPELKNLGIREQSFARLLTGHMPEAVSLKLRGWGVHDAAMIFARAIGLNRVFAEPLVFEQMAEHFIRDYHRYADSLFGCWLQMASFREITDANFRFALYASGEYTQMLEKEWGASEDGA